MALYSYIIHALQLSPRDTINFALISLPDYIIRDVMDNLREHESYLLSPCTLANSATNGQGSSIGSVDGGKGDIEYSHPCPREKQAKWVSGRNLIHLKMAGFLLSGE